MRVTYSIGILEQLEKKIRETGRQRLRERQRDSPTERSHRDLHGLGVFLIICLSDDKVVITLFVVF